MKKLLTILFLSTFIFSPIRAGDSPTPARLYSIGIASFYGNGEKLNKFTSNGEVFNPNDLTCASWDYPFNTMLKVTNLANNKFVYVRVNDRGANKRLYRLIDLSKKAFSKIANLEQGLITVKVERSN